MALQVFGVIFNSISYWNSVSDKRLFFIFLQIVVWNDLAFIWILIFRNDFNWWFSFKLIRKCWFRLLNHIFIFIIFRIILFSILFQILSFFFDRLCFPQTRPFVRRFRILIFFRLNILKTIIKRIMIKLSIISFLIHWIEILKWCKRYIHFVLFLLCFLFCYFCPLYKLISVIVIDKLADDSGNHWKFFCCIDSKQLSHILVVFEEFCETFFVHFVCNIIQTVFFITWMILRLLFDILIMNLLHEVYHGILHALCLLHSLNKITKWNNAFILQSVFNKLELLIELLCHLLMYFVLLTRINVGFNKLHVHISDWFRHLLHSVVHCFDLRNVLLILSFMHWGKLFESLVIIDERGNFFVQTIVFRN